MSESILHKDLHINLMDFREKTAHSSDFIEHRLKVGEIQCALIYCDGMVKQELIAQFMARSLSVLQKHSG